MSFAPPTLHANDDFPLPPPPPQHHALRLPPPQHHAIQPPPQQYALPPPPPQHHALQYPAPQYALPRPLPPHHAIQPPPPQYALPRPAHHAYRPWHAALPPQPPQHPPLANHNQTYDGSFPPLQYQARHPWPTVATTAYNDHHPWPPADHELGPPPPHQTHGGGPPRHAPPAPPLHTHESENTNILPPHANLATTAYNDHHLQMFDTTTLHNHPRAAGRRTGLLIPLSLHLEFDDFTLPHRIGVRLADHVLAIDNGLADQVNATETDNGLADQVIATENGLADHQVIATDNGVADEAIAMDDGLADEVIARFLNRAPPLEKEVCAICLDDLHRRDTSAMLLGCRHAFHNDCIGRWLRHKNLCPVCRAIAVPDNQI